MAEVIENSMKALKGKGRIIIGDVRDYRLLEAFKDRLQIEKFQHSVSVKEFKWAVQQDVLKEEELCFSPDYFYNLQSVFPEISNVNIQWKSGSYSNELSLYRYNVVIHVGEEFDVLQPVWQNWTELNLIDKVKKEINTGEPVIALKDVPNPRLWKERILTTSVVNNEINVVGDLLSLMETQDEESKDINDLIRSAERKGYSCTLLVDNDPFLVNIVLELNKKSNFISQPYRKGNNSESAFSNIPLFSDIASIMQKDLRAALQKSLPEYMIPSDFIAVSHLPLTNNGKVDRGFLALREERSVVNSQNYQPATTDVQKTLVNIWKELLGIDRIGIYDNFFELGGHSLLAIRVIAAIREEWEVELLVKDIFEYSTISEMSKYIEIQLNIYTLEDDSTEFEIVTI
jgi:acyl carrier protein